MADIIRSIQQFEYEQYTEMFNSLQEGIIVIDSPETEIKEIQTNNIKIFFANEMMQRLMFHMLGKDPD